MKRSPPGQQFIQHHAQAENIRTAIDSMPFATSLLWTHVGWSSDVAWPLADILFPQSQAKIGHERLAALVEEKVARLDVPMHQPLLVGMVQRLGHRRHQFDRFVQRETRLLEPCGEVGPVDVLRDDVAGAIFGTSDIMHWHDVRVIEVRNGAGFGQVGFGVFGPGDETAVRHLDSDTPLQLLVVRQVNDAETALSQDSLDAIATDVLWLLGGNFVHGCRPIWACAVGVVHGKSPPRLVFLLLGGL